MQTNEEKYCLDLEEVQEAVSLKLGTHYKVTTFSCETPKEVLGLLGHHVIIRTGILNETTSKSDYVTLFVKFLPKHKTAKEFARKIGAFEKELFVYELFDKFGEAKTAISGCTAKCWVKKENYLILDDLESQNYNSWDKQKVLSYESVLVVLQSLAKLHAASLIYEELKSSSGEKFRLNEQFPEELQESFFNQANDLGTKASIKGVLGEIKLFKYDSEGFLKKSEEVLSKIEDLVLPSKKYRNVLCHGDLWATNFLIKQDDKGVLTQSKLVDFQCARYVPPACDVLGFIFLTTSRQFRKKYLYQVLGMYYSYLEKNLKLANLEARNLISFSDFMESCEEYKVFGIVQACLYFPLILIKNECLQEYFLNEELNHKALFEDRTILVEKNLEHDFSYSSRLEESILDLKNYCEKLC